MKNIGVSISRKGYSVVHVGHPEGSTCTDECYLVPSVWTRAKKWLEGR